MRSRHFCLLALAGFIALGSIGQARAADPLPDRTPSPQEKEVVNLLKQRLKTAKECFDATQASYAADTIVIADLLDATAKLSEAELALAESPQQALDLMKKHAARLQQTEKKLESAMKAGAKGAEASSYLRVRRDRESAEIAVAIFKIQAKL